MAWGSLLIGCGLAVLALRGGLIVVVASVLVFTVGEMLYAPILSGFVAHRAPEGSRGRYLGLYGFTWSLAFAVTPRAGLGVYARHGPAALWIGCGLLGLLTALGYLALARRARHEAS